MSKDLKHSIHSSGDCLTEKMLFDYIDNTLTQKERHIVEKHLLDCDMCSDALEGLELVKDRGRITLIKNEINKRILSTTKEEAKIVPFNYKMVFSVAATIALLVVGVFIFNKADLKEESMSADIAELKETENSSPALSPPPPPPPVTVTDAEESGPAGAAPDQTVTTISGLTEESGKYLADKIVLEPEIAQTEQQKPTVFYKREDVAGESNNEVVMDEVSAAPAFGTTVVDATESPADDGDDRKKDKAEKITAAPKSNAAGDYEKDAKLSDKKAEEKAVSGTGANTYSWTTSSDANNDKQQNTENRTNTGNVASNNSVTKNTESLELSKEADKGKSKDIVYRSENKPAETSGKKKSPKKEGKATEDQDNFGGAVGYEPESVVKEKEKLKSGEELGTIATTTATTDSVVAAVTVAEIMPEYPGGDAAMLKFISQNFRYAQPLEQNNNQTIATKIHVQFIVETDGSIRDPKIIKGIDTNLDKEAIRVIKSMPKWTPGKQNGKAVPVIYKLPIQLEIK